VIDPVVEPIVAEIFALPSKYEFRRLQVTNPVAETVATVGALELQTAVAVTFCGGPNEYVAVAVSWRVPPLEISHDELELDVTLMDCNTGAWQLTVVDPDPPPLAAVIVTELLAPATHVTRPPETVATALLLDVHEAELVTFCGEP
jgi:hypothetical protein